jgi:hypothetical protein
MTLFAEHLVSNTFDPLYMSEIHRWLMEHIKKAGGILPIRNTGHINDVRGARGKLFELEESRLKIVLSDNELAVWIYLNAKKYIGHKSFNALLLEKILPVADSRAKNESDGNFLLQSVPRPWSNIQHCHIFDAGKYITKDLHSASKEEIISRFMRLAHPMNHFLFPNNPIKAEQNGKPEYQFVAATYMQNKYPLLFSEFLSHISPNVHFDWNSRWNEIGKSEIASLLLPEMHSLSQTNPPANNGLLVRRLPEDANCQCVMNKTQKDKREHSVRKIPRGEGLRDYTLSISWYIPNTGMISVGKFSFDLEALLASGTITKNFSNEYLFTIKRDGKTWRLGNVILP